MNAPGLRAADVLANERTFLAYVRTALSFIAFGFVIARFSLYVREISALTHVIVPNRQASTTFGTAMAIAGILIGIYGSYRYVCANAALNRNEIKPLSPTAAIIGGIVITAIGLIVAANLFAFH